MTCIIVRELRNSLTDVYRIRSANRNIDWTLSKNSNIILGGTKDCLRIAC